MMEMIKRIRLETIKKMVASGVRDIKKKIAINSLDYLIFVLFLPHTYYFDMSNKTFMRF